MSPEKPPGRPQVLVCALGGTIAMTRGAQPGVVPTLSGQALVDAVPDLAAAADVEATSFRQVPGAHLTLEDVVALAAFLLERAASLDGFVVTQGTDTIEETAFALDVLWTAPVPVVVTGAMRNPTLPGSDGPANLLAAAQVAVSPAARGLGCAVVLGDEIHAASLVQKRHSTRPSAFESPGNGPLGSIAEGVVRLSTTPRRITLQRPPAAPVPPVALLRAALGDDGRLIRAVADSDYAGLVVEAFGGGHVAPAMAEALGDLAARLPVVLASRTGAGAVLRKTYGFPGSEMDLLDRGLISAGRLDGLKARILLSLGLAAGLSPAEIATLSEG